MRDRSTVPVSSEGAPPFARVHPDADAWIAYHEGELEAAEEERLRGHLVKCPACVSTLLDLDAFAGGGDPGELSELERAAAWRAMRSALERQEAPTRAPGLAGGRFAVPWALAASLVAGVLGLALWDAHRTAGELRGTVTALTEPQINVPILDLFPDTATRSGGEAQLPAVPPAEFFTLLLALEEPREFPDYEVEILDAGGDVVWSKRGLEMSDFGNFKLGLSGRFLASGEHQIRLYGVEAGSRELLQDYAFRIE